MDGRDGAVDAGGAGPALSQEEEEEEDGRDGAPPAVGVIQVVVDVDPEYRKKALVQKITQKALYHLKYFTSLISPMRPA